MKPGVIVIPSALITSVLLETRLPTSWMLPTATKRPLLTAKELRFLDQINIAFT